MRERGLIVRETVNARAVRIEREHLDTVLRTATRVVASRGKKVVEFEIGDEPSQDDALAKAIIGRSGSLRAPALHRGELWLVGFNEDAWAAELIGPPG